MAFDTIIDKMQLENAMTATADAIRQRFGKSGLITWDASNGFSETINGLSTEEIIQHADIPDYVKAEALRVASAVESVRQDDSIVFLAMSDNHHYDNEGADSGGIQTNTSNLHAAMAAKILAYALKFDFMAQLGDATWGAQTTTSERLHAQADELLSFLRESHKDIPCFHAIGNHDTGIYGYDAGLSGGAVESGAWLYENFTALSASDNTVFGGAANGGYCYRDFTDKKLRVFLLNTSEALTVNKTDYATLGSQRKWFADALVNLNSKSDASAWSFLVLSHYPADYGNTMPLSELLKAYIQGSSITISLETGSNSTVNFSGKNKAKMIAQFHGHLHNFLVSKLYSYATGSGAQYDAWRICTPNAQYNRENYYTTVGNYTDINFQQDTTYGKTPNSAKDTSFVVNVINPSEQMIHSICYGAGIDRVVDYAAIVYYSITHSLTNMLLSNAPASVEEGTAYTATLTPITHAVVTSVKVTMGGKDITASAYSNGNINISKVTGNIVITAAAEIAYACVNQIPISTDASGAIYNGTGYKTKTYIQNGADSTNNATTATGYIPVKAGDVIRMRDMDFTKDDGNHRLVFYTSNKTYIGTAQANSPWYMDTSFGGVLNGNNYVQFTLVSLAEMTTNAAYMRICCANITPNSIVTVNEEIKYMDELASSYSITNSLTNAINNNASASVAGGSSYVAILAANNGYELKSVKVTMGDTDITSRVYSNGSIRIPYVTGNVVITVTAEKLVTYTNQIPISTNASGGLISDTGYVANTYLSSSNGAESYYWDFESTGFIPCKKGDVVRLQNVAFNKTTNSGSNRLVFYNSSRGFLKFYNAGSTYDPQAVVDSAGNWTQFTVPAAAGDVAYFRICCNGITTSSIITVNEEIT